MACRSQFFGSGNPKYSICPQKESDSRSPQSNRELMKHEISSFLPFSYFSLPGSGSGFADLFGSGFGFADLFGSGFGFADLFEYGSASETLVGVSIASEDRGSFAMLSC